MKDSRSFVIYLFLSAGFTINLTMSAMPIFFLRIIAVLVVPSLVLDPNIALAFALEPSRPQAMYPVNSFFASEALVQEFVQAWPIAKRSAVLLRQQENLTARINQSVRNLFHRVNTLKKPLPAALWTSVSILFADNLLRFVAHSWLGTSTDPNVIALRKLLPHFYLTSYATATTVSNDQLIREHLQYYPLSITIAVCLAGYGINLALKRIMLSRVCPEEPQWSAWYEKFAEMKRWPAVWFFSLSTATGLSTQIGKYLDHRFLIGVDYLAFIREHFVVVLNLSDLVIFPVFFLYTVWILQYDARMVFRIINLWQTAQPIHTVPTVLKASA